ncbi:MAG: LPXTG cell wall anchor domain-containing protein [Ruminococcus sp.]|nr:LPXTG cell wall anchor domain-containing protein [Ruminococcus sp.]
METAAPDGYSINDTIYKIDIAFVDPGDAYEGEDVTYTITVTKNKPNEGDGEDDLTKTYTVTLNGTNKKGDTEINVGEFGNEASGEKINIPNTKLGNLPSTGGIGTTIFTIGGCAIMIIAAGLFFASRRKSSKDSAKEA